jgi:hypothetical protein
MATDRQIAANRANARKSTGPRTAAGKAASSTNAIKSGIYSRTLIIPGEDPTDLQTLRDEHYQTFQPANIDERDLLDLLVKYKWQLRRLHDCYDQMWFRELEDDLHSEYRRDTSPLVRPFNSLNLYNDSLVKLSRMIHSTDRALHRTRTALIRAQEKRLRAESKPTPKLASFPQKTRCLGAPHPPEPPCSSPRSPSPPDRPGPRPLTPDPGAKRPAARTARPR